MTVIVLFFFTFLHLPYRSATFGTEFRAVFESFATVGAFLNHGLTTFGTELAIGGEQFATVRAGLGHSTSTGRAYGSSIGNIGRAFSAGIVPLATFHAEFRFGCQCSTTRRTLDNIILFGCGFSIKTTTIAETGGFINRSIALGAILCFCGVNTVSQTTKLLTHCTTNTDTHTQTNACAHKTTLHRTRIHSGSF